MMRKLQLQALAALYFATFVFSGISLACPIAADIKSKMQNDIQSRKCSVATNANHTDTSAIFDSDRYCLNDTNAVVTDAGFPSQSTINHMFERYTETYKGLSFEDKIGFADLFLQRASRMFISTWDETEDSIIIYINALDEENNLTKVALQLFEQDHFSYEFRQAFTNHISKHQPLRQPNFDVLKHLYDVLYVKSCEA